MRIPPRDSMKSWSWHGSSFVINRYYEVLHDVHTGFSRKVLRGPFLSGVRPQLGGARMNSNSFGAERKGCVRLALCLKLMEGAPSTKHLPNACSTLNFSSSVPGA